MPTTDDYDDDTPYTVGGGEVSLSAREWNELVKITLAHHDGPVRDFSEMVRLITDACRAGAAHAARYDANAIAAALVKAGLPSTDVPASDLPGKIKQLGQMLEAARHQARTLAGDVADLTNRLEDELPTIFDTCLDELSSARAAAQVELCAEDVHEVGIAAFRLALRLVTDHELRERDASRRPRRLDCECDPSVFEEAPGDGSTWTCPHGNRWRGENGGYRVETDAEYLAEHPIRFPTSFVNGPDDDEALREVFRRQDQHAAAFRVEPTVDGGTDYFHRDGATRVVGQDGLTPRDRGQVPHADPRAPSPVHYTYGPGIVGAEEILTYDPSGDTVTSLWGIPIDLHHPSVAYIADSLVPYDVTFTGCDGSLECRRATIASVLRSTIRGVEFGPDGHAQAVHRAALELLDSTSGHKAEFSTGAARDVIRAALTHATIFPKSGDAT